MNELRPSKNIIENYRATPILVGMIFKCQRWYDEILREIVLDVNTIERDGVRCDTRKARGCSRCHPLHLSTRPLTNLCSSNLISVRHLDRRLLYCVNGKLPTKMCPLKQNVKVT